MSVSNVSTTNPLFIDPITYDVMEDPVVCSDGRTYDRSTAAKMPKSPFTREPLTILVDNVDLRGAIFEAKPEVCASYAEHKASVTEVRPPAPVASLANGYGMKRLPSGATLKGEFINGQLNGAGELRSGEGTVIRGMFRDNMVEGYAEARYSDGRYYRGEYHRGRPHGRGYLRFPSGYVFVGEFKRGLKHGLGVEIFPNKSRYFCTMQHDRVVESERLE